MTLIISNNEIEDIKIVKSLKDSGLLIKGVTENAKWSKRTKTRIS